mmetsp:Transcript_7828/g.22285  ORF Transcript_7828/g.22285 Transcript_7828/m.22285 type:complete len:226 (-) Transcript_7828:154-831(-)
MAAAQDSGTCSCLGWFGLRGFGFRQRGHDRRCRERNDADAVAESAADGGVAAALAAAGAVAGSGDGEPQAAAPEKDEKPLLKDIAASKSDSDAAGSPKQRRRKAATPASPKKTISLVEATSPGTPVGQTASGSPKTVISLAEATMPGQGAFTAAGKGKGRGRGQQVCRNFQNGYCWYGEQCRFLHQSEWQDDSKRKAKAKGKGQNQRRARGSGRGSKEQSLGGTS